MLAVVANLFYGRVPLKLALHVPLVTRGNEAAAAIAPFVRLHCTQDKRITHE